MNIDYITIAKSLRGGLFMNFNPIETPILLINLYNKCQINDCDDIVDKIFKSLILAGNIMDATKLINSLGFRTDKNRAFIPTDVSDFIFYKQSTDTEISIFAKSIYYHTCQNKEFLKWQIDKLIKDGSFDYDEEMKKYLEYKKREE